jgi:hypothetical protein
LLSALGRNFLLGNRKKIAKIKNEYFYMPLYLSLWFSLYRLIYAMVQGSQDSAECGQRLLQRYSGRYGKGLKVVGNEK